ncbi:MAG TPA: DUF835 domain-containing protein [Thermoplasmata archaeon]|nr:DUF835 domain-containing protein [Thermoplasmata archaeon]
MPSMPAKAPAPPTPELAVGQGPPAAGPRNRLAAGLVVLALVAVLLASPRAAAGTFPVSVEQVAVGTTDGTAGVQAEDGIRETMREADVAPDPLAYPAMQNLSNGSQVSGTFPADVRISDGVYVQYREATPAPVTVSNNPASVAPGCTWTTCGSGMVSDNAYASSPADGDAVVYTGFGFSVPTAAVISRVELGYEAFVAGNDRITDTLSWDTGATWCPAITPGGLPGSDPNAYTFLDFTTCTGHAWTPADFGGNLSARITHVVQGAGPETIDLDANVIRVTYQPVAYTLSLEYDWTGVAAGQGHDLRVRAHVSDENVSVEVLTPPSVWTPRLLFTDTTDQVLTYTLTASAFAAGNVSVRFVDALGPDVASSDLWIDSVDVVTTVVAYHLDVSQTVTGVGGANPTLDVEGNISAGGENFDVFAWNFTAGVWNLKMGSAFTAVNEMHRAALLPDEILNGTVRIDFRDRDPASAVPATLTLELVQVSTTDPASGLSSVVLLGGGVIAGIAAAAGFVFFVVLPKRKASSDDAEAAPEPPRNGRLPSLGGLFAKGGAPPPDPAIAVGDLRAGGAYLVDEPKPAAAMRVLEHVTRMGRSGFVITRRNPVDVQRTFKLPHTKIVGLGENRDPGSGLVLAASSDVMATDVGDFLRTNPVGVVLIDCLKDLVEGSDFPAVLRFLRGVVEQVSAGQQILLVSMPPGILRGRELKQLAQQLEVVRIT